MISYKPLQKLLIDKEINKTKLKEITGLSSATIAKFGSNEYVSLEVIDRICESLECQPVDLIEYIPKEQE